MDQRGRRGRTRRAVPLAADLIDAEVRLDLTKDKVACAPGVLAQILRNVVSNSIKFRSHERKLRLRLTSNTTPQTIELAIEDNGVGVDEEGVNHAFEPYYRGSTAREVPGHGLGLAIVERATTMLGGRCDISPVTPQGTRITICLPRAP